jgi:hypothetical protein
MLVIKLKKAKGRGKRAIPKRRKFSRNASGILWVKNGVKAYFKGDWGIGQGAKKFWIFWKFCFANRAKEM